MNGKPGIEEREVRVRMNLIAGVDYPFMEGSEGRGHVVGWKLEATSDAMRLLVWFAVLDEREPKRGRRQTACRLVSNRME